jgi:hypothetical protein
MPPILRCRFPFPPQDPPVVMPEACSAKCPHYDANVLAGHTTINEDDPDLLEALDSFLAWFYKPGQDIDEQRRFAAELYVRKDHTGTCIPKTVLFMHLKHLQFDSDHRLLELTAEAAAALKGRVVASWPDAERCSGQTWNEMFARYLARYE